MRKLVGSLLLCAASLGMSHVAMAAPIVADGSAYSIYLGQPTADEDFFGAATFDNIAESTTFRGVNFIVSESETDLGEGRSRITINVNADGDIFPIAGDEATFGIGVDGDNALKFVRSISLLDARVSFFGLNDMLLLATDNLADQVATNDPWDGIFPEPFDLFGTDGLGGQNVRSVQFDFVIGDEETTDVPEPTTILLAGLGLMALLALRRQRRK